MPWRSDGVPTLAWCSGLCVLSIPRAMPAEASAPGIITQAGHVGGETPNKEEHPGPPGTDDCHHMNVFLC
ncbi:hypothetical protein JTE90_001897 [Oedothorax gibbosus]|uniref:Secreted protein n=1 Tax=Oedothorax gibbosus TaxID=931172 RepID=A0AAV6VTN3_9ARAC|nr:hypothetical protein JTE90_001897 [Oedothorax gibbosus]